MTELTHLDDSGQARMVDISGKVSTERSACAQAIVKTRPDVIDAIRTNSLSKGDALAVARVAAILAAKQVDRLIPLCHTLPLSSIDVDFVFGDDYIQVVTRAATNAATGVEMEALTAATVAALALYDMAKAVDKRIIIESVHLLTKSGGKSGDFTW